MLIVAKQDNVDNLYAIWDTVTDRFLGVNLGYDSCIKEIMHHKNCCYAYAENRVDHPQPFCDIAEYIYRTFDPEYVLEEPDTIRNAVRLIANHYKGDEYFRNAFITSISSALKDLPKESDLEDAAKAIADRIIGEE